MRKGEIYEKIKMKVNVFGSFKLHYILFKTDLSSLFTPLIESNHLLKSSRLLLLLLLQLLVVTLQLFVGQAESLVGVLRLIDHTLLVSDLISQLRHLLLVLLTMLKICSLRFMIHFSQ